MTIFIHVNKCIILSFLLAGVEGRGTGAGMTLFIHVDKYIILSFLPVGAEGRGTGATWIDPRSATSMLVTEGCGWHGRRLADEGPRGQQKGDPIHTCR